MNITKKSSLNSERPSRCAERLDAIQLSLVERVLMGPILILPVRMEKLTLSVWELLQIVRLEYLVALIRRQAIRYYRASCIGRGVQFSHVIPRLIELHWHLRREESGLRGRL